MRRLLPLLLAAPLMLAVPAATAPAWAQVTPETRAAARAMVEASGGVAQARQAATMMRQQLIAIIAQNANKPVPEVTKVVDEVLMPEMLARVPELIDGMADIWAKHLSVQELQQLVEFYKTPLGQKLIAVSPQVAAETLPLATSWGQAVATDALAKQRDTLRQRGLNL